MASPRTLLKLSWIDSSPPTDAAMCQLGEFHESRLRNKSAKLGTTVSIGSLMSWARPSPQAYCIPTAKVKRKNDHFAGKLYLLDYDVINSKYSSTPAIARSKTKKARVRRAIAGELDRVAKVSRDYFSKVTPI